MVFSVTAVLFYFPTSNVHGLQFLRTLAKTYHFLNNIRHSQKKTQGETSSHSSGQWLLGCDTESQYPKYIRKHEAQQEKHVI